MIYTHTGKTPISIPLANGERRTFAPGAEIDSDACDAAVAEHLATLAELKPATAAKLEPEKLEPKKLEAAKVGK